MGKMKEVYMDMMNKYGEQRIEEIQYCPVIPWKNKQWFYDKKNELLINVNNYDNQIKFKNLSIRDLMWIKETIDWLAMMNDEFSEIHPKEPNEIKEGRYDGEPPFPV